MYPQIYLILFFILPIIKSNEEELKGKKNMDNWVTPHSPSKRSKILSQREYGSWTYPGPWFEREESKAGFNSLDGNAQMPSSVMNDTPQNEKNTNNVFNDADITPEVRFMLREEREKKLVNLVADSDNELCKACLRKGARVGIELVIQGRMKLSDPDFEHTDYEMQRNVRQIMGLVMACEACMNTLPAASEVKINVDTR